MTESSIFARIEAALDAEGDEVRQDLATLRSALDQLLKSGDAGEKKSARRARLAVDRTATLFDELYELREKMSNEAATTE
jgi:hypothetical protein